MADTENSGEPQSNEEILRVARERFKFAEESESEMRVEELEDMRFRAGEQWPLEIKQQRALEKRPCLTINKLVQPVHQICNDQRQNRPSIKVNPVDDKADIETAKVYQGMIRHIEYSSNADVAYDTGFEGTVIKGRGYLRVITDYCDPMSFNQEIRIKRVRNSFSVYLDPTHQEPDASDANWGFVFEDIAKEDFKAEFPKAKACSHDGWESLGNTAPEWTDDKTVRVAEYFYKTFKRVTIVQLNNGSVIEKKQLEQAIAQGLQPISERETVLPAIKWCKINGDEILEETDWLGQWIPIIPIIGDELDIDGKKKLEGIVRQSRDPQRMYNYWVTAETEMIALAPRAPYIVGEGQIEGYEEQWKTANTKSHAVLQYKLKTVGGQLVGPPQRNFGEPPVQAITNARVQSSDDIKATTGIYDTSLGNRSNESSGIAINRRNAQAQTSNFHFVDNLSRALRHLGRIIVDLIPKIYDTAQAVRVLGEDGQAEMVQINQVFDKGGEQVSHMLGAGKYDVTVATGPSFATKRQEASETMLEFTKSIPSAAPIIGDLIVRNMDWPGSQEIADRLKKSLPPGMAEEKDSDKPKIPPEAQAQLQQMNQLIEQLTQKLNEAHDQLDTKTIELESKERIEFAKIQANVEIELAKMGSVEAQAMLKVEVAQIQKRLELLHMNQPIENENEMDAGPDQTMQPNLNQPTGGPSPGTPME